MAPGRGGSIVMYLWAFLITGRGRAGGWTGGDRRGRAAPAGARVSERTAVGLLRNRYPRGAHAGGGLMFPQLRGRTPPKDGVAFTPNPFTDPLVLSCGLGALALAVGWYLAVRRGDRSWLARVGLGTGVIVAAVWLFYLIGRFVA